MGVSGFFKLSSGGKGKKLNYYFYYKCMVYPRISLYSQFKLSKSV